MPRNYTDYLEASVNAIKHSPIPKPFARWTALSSVAGALGRRVWFPMPNYDIAVSYTHLTLPTNREV